MDDECEKGTYPLSLQHDLFCCFLRLKVEKGRLDHTSEDRSFYSCRSSLSLLLVPRFLRDDALIGC